MTPDATQPEPAAAPTTTVTRTTTPDSHQREQIDPLFLLLLGATILFALLTAVIAKWSPSDGQTFQFFCGITTSFGGACLLRAKPPQSGGGGSTTTTKTSSE